MKYILIADSKASPVSFFPWWKMVAFVLITLMILVMLFPKYLFINTLVYTQPAPVIMSYLQAFREKRRDNVQLLFALIEQEIGLGNMRDAEEDIAHLKTLKNPLTADLAHQFSWLDYLIVRHNTYHKETKPSDRIVGLRTLRQMAAAMSDAPLSPKQLQTLARDSLGLAQPRTALKIYNELMNEHALNSPEELAEGAGVAMQNNAHLDSAKFYWAAYVQADDLGQKKQYALKTMQVLWAGNFVQGALNIVAKLPEKIIRDRDILVFVTRLAQAADRADIAQYYALQGLEKFPIDNEVEALAFQTLMHNAHIKAAYELAIAAVVRHPNDLSWHEKLAQSATWAGSYDVGMREWLYVVQHTSDEHKIKYAILNAKLLSYDAVLVDMLQIYLGRYPKDTQATFELAQAQNRVGQPNMALLTLQIVDNLHPMRAADTLRAMIYQDGDQWGKALQVWRKMDKVHGPNIQSVMAQAEIYYSHGRFQDAVNILKTGMV